MFEKLRGKFKEFVEEEKSLKPKESLETKVKKKIKREAQIKEKDIESLLEELYLSLLSSDVSLTVADSIKKDLKEALVDRKIKSGTRLEEISRKSIREVISRHLEEPENYLDEQAEDQEKPFVILFLGPNGHGKTTTIAKIGKILQEKGMEVVLSAADTFRAASIEQVSKWAEELDAKIIKHDYGADPAAVCYDAKEHAEKNNKDVVLIDTAGRSELDKNLMNQLEKIKRTVEPNHSMYIAEAVAGNSAVKQAKQFNEKIGIDGITVTKVDTDTKGGCLLSLSSEVKKPIHYLGTGQGLRDIQRFKKEWYLDKIIPK